jgi:RNA polymerase sigma-70 factor (ECF subfamily)
LQTAERRFACVFDALYATLCDQAHRVMRDPSRAEDVVQDVFAAVWRRRDVLLGDSLTARETVERLSGYLRVAVRNRCRALLARDITADRHASQARAAAQGDGVAAMSPAGDDDLAARELRDRLDRAIAQLPPQQRVVLLLRRFDGMSTAEVAERLGLSVKTVENHLGRALQRLAAVVRE